MKEKFLRAERNTARDTKLAQIPATGTEKTAKMRTGETTKVVTWQWQKENRVFVIPQKMAEALNELPFTRDVILAVGHIYRIQGCPPDCKIRTTAREIANVLGLKWEGSLGGKIEDALTLARMLTIQNTTKKYKKSKVWYEKIEVYGFIDGWTRVKTKNGKPIPENKQPLVIQLSEEFAEAIKNSPLISVPVAAIEAARKAPARCRTAAKNILFYLASLQPLDFVTISEEKLLEVSGISSRKDKAHKSLATCLKTLEGVFVKKWEKEGDKYHISLYPQRV